jgi:hypothetical protein
MIEYTFEYQPNNTEALHDQLKTAFGERYVSMDSSDAGLIIRFRSAQREDEAAIRAILREHKPNERTRRQQKADDKPNARRRLLDLDIAALRTENVDRVVLAAILNALEDLQKILED